MNKAMEEKNMGNVIIKYCRERKKIDRNVMCLTNHRKDKFLAFVWSSVIVLLLHFNRAIR